MKKIVMCFGAFDGLHQGHEDFFRQAKDRGDELVVIVARDATVVELTGDLPGRNERDRLTAVNNHPLVDSALLGHEDDRYTVIEEIRPDVICLGHDQEAFTESLDAELARRGVSAIIERCEQYVHSTFKMPASIESYEEEPETAGADYEERGMPM
jgi:FAD synthetase